MANGDAEKPNEQDIVGNFKKAVITGLKDVKNIEVITAVAEDVTLGQGNDIMDQLKNAQLAKVSRYARSEIQIEGDRYTVLPSGGKDDYMTQQVIQTHNENTQNAIQTWNNMARVVFTSLAIVSEMVGKPLGKDVIDLIGKFGIINKID